MKNLFLLIFLFVTVFSACRKEEISVPQPEPQPPRPVLPEMPYNYSDLNYPEHFETVALQFILGFNLVNNPISDEGATLGRVLFYDKMLSVNGEKSCASCHQQERGFSDPERFSLGFDGRMTRRNSMTLSNLLYTRRFFWDNRAGSLQEQVLLPIEDDLEMGHNLDSLRPQMAESEYYPDLFTAAFGNDTITDERIADALAQFINSMTSYSSKYDAGLNNDFANFTAEEKLGRELYFERQLNCNQCHTNAVLGSNTLMNNGLVPDGIDFGRAEITGNPDNNYEFKVPTLRNIALTAPYMHDGRFATLEEVIEHYNSGIRAHPNLDERVTTDNTRGGNPRTMDLTAEEKAALVAFLHTLTDEVLVTDERWSNPFER